MNENVYFECRKKAAIHNERLNSRAGAAEILGISESTLAHYELGITKNIPVDVVVMMAEVYNAPELKCIYCKSECPIGKELPIATEAGNIEGITVRMLAGLEDEKIDKIQKTLLRIAEDGKVEAAEREKLKEIRQFRNICSKADNSLMKLQGDIWDSMVQYGDSREKQGFIAGFMMACDLFRTGGAGSYDSKGNA